MYVIYIIITVTNHLHYMYIFYLLKVNNGIDLAIAQQLKPSVYVLTITEYIKKIKKYVYVYLIYVYLRAPLETQVDGQKRERLA